MIDKSLFTNSNFGLKTLGFTDEVIMAWNKAVKPLRSSGFHIMEFDPKSKSDNRWFLIVNPKMSTDNVSFVKDRDYHIRLNERMKNGFISNDLSSNYWSSIFTDIELAGFSIPVDDLRVVDITLLHSNLDFYRLHLEYFPYQDLMMAINGLIKQNTNAKYLGALVTWNYIYYYSIFLHRIKSEEENAYGLYGKWYSEYFDVNDYYRRLPSEQITISLLRYCEALISKPTYDVEYDFKQRVIPSIQSFFEFNGNELNTLLVDSKKELVTNLTNTSFIKISKAIIDVFILDEEELFLQEVLDNRSQLFLHDALPVMLQMKYGPNSIYNVSGVIKDKIFESDNRKAGEFKEDADLVPKLVSSKHQIYIENVQYWYDYTTAERDEILGLIRFNITEELASRLENVIQNRCLNHWVNLINKISAPILTWKDDNDTFFPQWNLFEDQPLESLVEEYQFNEAEVIIEQKLLDNHLKRINQIQFGYSLDAYLDFNKPLFMYEPFQIHWEEELGKAKERIEQKERFYKSRMLELGIYDSPLNFVDRNICLVEMMQIEKEIRPYVQFVKKAFQTALPVRKVVNFSATRHASNGVEFDPDTLFNQEKWIRADVMKVMESSIEQGEAVQINTFCLDFSGSMRHDRMRNLFKVLYLLVLGLEDRKSFDAFHFFSNNFIEVVNFSSEFTSRKVLFKILRQISILEFNRVVYGGYGATNMSEGMEKSLDKMKSFSKEFKASNPNVNLVTSMFVISDGEPNLGVTNPKSLNQFVAERRKEDDVEIKGIFIKSEEDVNLSFLNEIFGEENCVESSDFKEGVDRFVSIMTKTYKKQRKAYKWKQKKQKLGLG